MVIYDHRERGRVERGKGCGFGFSFLFLFLVLLACFRLLAGWLCSVRSSGFFSTTTYPTRREDTVFCGFHGIMMMKDESKLPMKSGPPPLCPPAGKELLIFFFSSQRVGDAVTDDGWVADDWGM